MRRPPPQTLRELELRAHALAGRSVGELAQALGVQLPVDPKRGKGFVGQILELALGADPDAGDSPDFSGLAVELKSVPVRPDNTPVESTFVCAITMDEADQEVWETSRLWRRLQHVLWIPVEERRTGPLAVRKVGKPVLWKPCETDQAQLRADWEDLIGAIGAGRGGTLTAREGVVLQVRPKAATSRVRTLAPGEGGPQMALPLGFYLRAKFVAGVLGG